VRAICNSWSSSASSSSLGRHRRSPLLSARRDVRWSLRRRCTLGMPHPSKNDGSECTHTQGAGSGPSRNNPTGMTLLRNAGSFVGCVMS
jgi:hypothetical protein